MLAHDIETASRCAIAALSMIGGEVQSLDLPPPQAQRLAAWIKMARDHVGEILEGDQPSCSPAERRRAPSDTAASEGRATDRLEAEATAAWAAAGALRNAPSAAAAEASRAQLRRLAEHSPHERVRRLATRVLDMEAG